MILAMSSGIAIPNEAVKYILLQRTHYLALTRNRLYRVLSRPSPWLAFNLVVMLESGMRKKQVKLLFNQDMIDEYEAIRPWLPDRVSTILDIGCGVGGIDVLLFKHYDCSQDLVFYLLDKTSIDRRIHYGFRRESAFYNSLRVTESVLSHNGIPRENLHLLEATADRELDISADVDLVISLLSWGFHYPISTYLEQVHALLKQGGHLLLDIRKGSGGERELEQRFSSVQVVSEARKGNKVLAIK